MKIWAFNGTQVLPQKCHNVFRLRRAYATPTVAIPKPATFDDDLKGYPGKPRAFADADNKIGGPYAENSETESNCARSLEELIKDYCAGIAVVDDNLAKVFQALSFYLEKESLYPATSSWAPPDELLGSFIHQYIEAQEASTPCGSGRKCKRCCGANA